MRRASRLVAWLAAVLLALPVFAAQREDAEPVFSARGSIQVAFAPWDDAEGLLSEVLGSARRQILVQAFLLTSRTFALTSSTPRHVALRCWYWPMGVSMQTRPARFSVFYSSTGYQCGWRRGTGVRTTRSW